MLQARAVHLLLEEEVCILLERGATTNPPVVVDEVISLLGTILKNDMPVYREELKEGARRVQKGRGVQFGLRLPKLVKDLLDEGFQETYAQRFGQKACEGLNAQIQLLEQDEAKKRFDGLGADVVDYGKGKCIQLKAITAHEKNKFAERLREAAGS